MFSVTSFIQYAKYALVLVVIFGSIGLYFYIQNLQEKVDTLEFNNQTLYESVEKQQNLIDTMNIQITFVKDKYIEFGQLNMEQERKIEELDDKFVKSANGNKRDLGELATKKTQLIQNAINNGTKDVNRCFELLSGAELREGEDENTIEKCEK